MTQSTLRTGMLVHGRHLQAVDWEQMAWGDAANGKLGTLPTAIMAVLNEYASHFILITFGTGSSHDTQGRTESQATKQLLIDRFDDLEQFTAIRNHPRWTEEKEVIRKLVAGVVTDVVTQNTKEEIVAAAALFREHQITKVIEVTGASHGPRCQQLQAITRADGAIPQQQYWQLVTDDVPFANSAAGDTTIFEVPHRGDDPMMQVSEEIRPAKLFSQFFAIPKEQREAFLEDFAKLLQKYR